PNTFYLNSPPLNLYEKDPPTRPQLLLQPERIANLKKEGLLSENEYETCKDAIMALLDKLG
ncbi:MAG: hypothetical protein DRG83_21180, partial [Deltaproteobacteria bacterium]